MVPFSFPFLPSFLLSIYSLSSSKRATPPLIQYS